MWSFLYPEVPRTSPALRSSRRHFLKCTLSAAALAPLAACDGLGLEPAPAPLFDGPTIEEDDFIAFNAKYYGTGVHADSQLPYSFLRDGTPSNLSDPVSIAFRLQHLLSDSNYVSLVDTLLNQLLASQIDASPPNNFRNMIPQLLIQPSGIVPMSKDYSFADNALLSSRVAMAAQAYKEPPRVTRLWTSLISKSCGTIRFWLNRPQGFCLNSEMRGFSGLIPRA